MARTLSTMLPLGTKAPEFSLVDTDGATVSLTDYRGSKGLLVIFLCNHCPYVKHVADELKKIADQYIPRGIAVVGISSNDVANYPEDSPEKMREEKKLRGYAFPYLYDPTQEVAKAYHAACTPDFFLFDGDQKLVYRGQMDDSRPKTDKPVTGSDLRAALDALLAGKPPLDKQTPSLGCNIKWIEGSEPGYFAIG
ncbi:MAG: thioredoxin family protein [Planctomycetaceae bacterium]